MDDPRANWKPSVVWLEGVLDYFNAELNDEHHDRLKIGIGVGRQVIGLYLAEMLLKYALDDLHKPYEHDHSLLELFRTLPRQRRRTVERKYSNILSESVPETWDFARSVDSFLEYLGPNPITDSRYFWERFREHDISIIFMPEKLGPLIYALFIVLHRYPEGPPSGERRHETKFVSFEDSLTARKESRERDGRERRPPREGARPVKYWLEGLLYYFNLPFPHESGDPRLVGFQVGQRVIGLYLAEILLKYALGELGLHYAHNHDLYALFQKLSEPTKLAIEEKYQELLHRHVSSTWEYARSVESLLQYSGSNPLTETRYFWEPTDKEILPLSASTLLPLIYALLIELHGYPQGDPLEKRHETTFAPLDVLLER